MNFVMMLSDNIHLGAVYILFSRKQLFSVQLQRCDIS